MIRLQRPVKIRKESNFLADERGAAAVEFGLIASIVTLLMCACLDVSRLMLASRDVERAASEASQALAACKSGACVLAAGQVLMSHQANAFMAPTPMTTSWAYVSRSGSNILVSFGNMTHLPTDVRAEALKILPGDNDNGVCTLITTTIKPVSIVKTWPSGTFGNKRYIACTLQSKGVKVI
jgi:Flp pilus assembly pilin Flp